MLPLSTVGIALVVHDRILTPSGLLYANLGGLTIVFEESRGWSPVTANLPFLAFLVGILAAAMVNVYNNKYYFRRFTENGN
jgi:DHA1 family multidrug resistance protein-like MFS transporter